MRMPAIWPIVREIVVATDTSAHGREMTEDGRGGSDPCPARAYERSPRTAFNRLSRRGCTDRGRYGPCPVGVHLRAGPVAARASAAAPQRRLRPDHALRRPRETIAKAT